MHFYNTLSRKVELFKPLKGKKVRMYTCGPTVYNFAHIGNLRAYIVSDLVRRHLKSKGLEVFQVMNLTDVDDKTIRGASAEGAELSKFTERFTAEFFKDIDALQIQRADIYPKATAHIKEMVAIVLALLKKGLAYKGADKSVYFDISKFPGYGGLAQLQKQSLQAGASGRVIADEYARESIADFALWKAWDESDGDVFWETALGKGRPGWHIECSAMSEKYLGVPFDIHLGGVDLIFPHHTNEIAQSEGAWSKKFVNFWIHNEHLLVEGRKMSKSLGNFYTLRDLIARDVDPLAFRYLMLSSHYRAQNNFTWAGLRAAQATLEKLQGLLNSLAFLKSRARDDPAVRTAAQFFLESFEAVLDDDLNTPKALAALHAFANDVQKRLSEKTLSAADAKRAMRALQSADAVLGVLRPPQVPKVALLPVDTIERLLKEREGAKKRKDYAAADRIRSELREKGVIVEDTSSGPVWKTA